MKTIEDLREELKAAKEERRVAKAGYDNATRKCNSIGKQLYERFLSEDTARLDLIDVGTNVMLQNAIAELPVYVKTKEGKYVFTSILLTGFKSKLRNFYSKGHDGVKADDRAIALIMYEYDSNDLKKELSPLFRLVYDTLKPSYMKRVKDALYTRNNTLV